MTGAIFSFSEKGALVERLRPGGGSAEDAGVSAGDIIQTFDDRNTEELNLSMMTEIVAEKANGNVKVHFWRKSDESEVDTLMKLPPILSTWNFFGDAALKQKSDMLLKEAGHVNGH